MPETNGQVHSAILGLHAQTSLHPGSGTALGTVDLPVQRERHTLWPMIPGSALKGVLRDACRDHVKAEHGGDRTTANRENRRLTATFGPPTESAGEHAGALSVTDARLLAFPVRSLKGVFAWVTCPAVLERLARDLALGRASGLDESMIPQVKRDNVVVPGDDCPCLHESTHVVLEEFVFERTANTSAEVAGWVARHLLPDSPAFTATKERFCHCLLVLHDDDFTHFARHATEIVARVGLEIETKTVKDGALFYEEFLPPESLFYALVLAHDARGQAGPDKGAAGVLEFLSSVIPPFLQVGANETTGKGYCATRLFPLGGAK